MLPPTGPENVSSDDSRATEMTADEGQRTITVPRTSYKNELAAAALSFIGLYQAWCANTVFQRWDDPYPKGVKPVKHGPLTPIEAWAVYSVFAAVLEIFSVLIVFKSTARRLNFGPWNRVVFGVLCSPAIVVNYVLLAGLLCMSHALLEFRKDCIGKQGSLKPKNGCLSYGYMMRHHWRYGELCDVDQIALFKNQAELQTQYLALAISAVFFSLCGRVLSSSRLAINCARMMDRYGE